MKYPTAPRYARILAAALTAITVAAQAAGPFTVSTTGDTHATNAVLSANDSSGHISLRSALEAANAQAGATTITVPAGTYNLSLGELSLSPAGGKTTVVTGAGAASTIINQLDGLNRVLNIDINSAGGTTTTLSGLTLQGGHDSTDLLGGAGILAGSVLATPKDVLWLSNCTIQNNHCTTNTTQQPGGGIQMAGGDLYISSCTFSNNSSGQSLGGAIFTLAQSVVSSLRVTNSLFANNSVTNNSGAGPDGGGAIMIETPAGSSHTIVGCTFTNNRALGNSGATFGGALQLNGGALTIISSVFVNNSVTGQGGLGGAIYADSGAVNLTLCRLSGNTASVNGSAFYNHGSNLAVTVATNNWWGCNAGPGPAGCAVAVGDGNATNFIYAPWLVITNTASPNPIFLGQSTTLTASVLKNSAGQSFTPAQVGVLLGLPLVWNAGPHGSLGAAQSVIQPTGLATAVFTNDNTCNAGQPTVTLENGAATALVVVQCPDLAVTKTNNVNGSVVLGNGWNWTVHIANSGAAPATFPAGSTIALDNLPAANATYGSPTLANPTGLTGSPTVSLDASANLTVAAPAAVTLGVGGSFDVVVPVTPAALGAVTNPRLGGLCLADPNNVIPESSKANNAATNTVTVTCPTITATASGNATVCPGSTATITVTVTGGKAPYSVTLNNAGGTQIGNSPLYFAVTPEATATYQVSSGLDANGCPLTGGGGATVTVSAVTSPIVTLTPASVFPDTLGNQASVPPIYSTYAWSIANGSILGPTNAPVVSYVPGSSNMVVLGVTVTTPSGCGASAVTIVPVTTGFSVHTNVVFTDALGSRAMGIAFDGTNYWSCSGGTSTGVRLARYGLNGSLLATYSPSLDFRSLMTRADGTLLARSFNSNTIYQQTSPGVFASSGVTLTGGALNSQSSVVLNGAGTEYDAMFAGVVARWATNGTYLGAVTLNGYTKVPGEDAAPQNRGLAAMGNLWLTYNGTNILSLWDTNGNRLTQLSLPGAGTNFDSSYSFSYCNGKVFIVDISGTSWRAFDLYSAASVAVLAAEASGQITSDVTNKIAGVGVIPKVDLIPVFGAASTPSLSQLRNYQSVLVFSDNSFSDPVSMGNVLADYLDQGGGVVVQPLAFATNSASYGLRGRVSTNGYLPFTATTYTTVAGATLIKDLPGDPLLYGVSALNSGTGGWQNVPMYTNAGALQVAHWSSGGALAGGRNDGAGRCAGLNFYPASSDVLASGWVASTDGARLMANGLLWSGRIPPTILSGPAAVALPPGAVASFSVTAAGAGPLAYQWRFNGTNLLSATGSSLSVPVQSGNYGAYSVVVSNLYGLTTSLNAPLVPQLRFLSPAIDANGGFSLYLVNADGTAVAASRAARVNIYATTDLLAPFSLWSLLTNTVVSAGAGLRVDGFSVTNGPTLFFRATEVP